MEFQLIKYDAMCVAIAEAYEVDEVKEIRDKAVAMEAYFRVAKNPEPERRACEIRLRSERRAGQLLGQMKKAGGGDKGRNQHATWVPPSSGMMEPPTLANMGITNNESSQWQQLALVEDDVFEAALAAPEKPSVNGILQSHRRCTSLKPKAKRMNKDALWLWGRLRDFERDNLLDQDFDDLLGDMTEGMQADVRRLSPLVSKWLDKL